MGQGVVYPGGRRIAADRPEYWCSIDERALRENLLKLSREAQGRIMLPILAQAAGMVRDVARSLAPRRTGALRAGIVARELKWGPGYAQYLVTLDPAVYYGKFLEFGLGEKREGGLNERARRRRANADRSLLVQAGIQTAMRKHNISFEEAMKRAGLRRSKGKRAGKLTREGKRQAILEAGGTLQGMRRPNMAPRPFLRPAVKFFRNSIRQWMIKELWGALVATIASVGAPTKKAA